MAKSELVHYKGFEDFIYGMAEERPHAIMLLCERDGKLCRITWRDFADDEAGLIPKDLKRGVLSEDAVWNVLEDSRNLNSRMEEVLNPCDDRG